MYITKEMLMDVTCNKVQVFLREWPNGAEVSLATARRAIELGLDLEWAAQHLLSDAARRAYKNATVSAQRAYGKATAPALAVYEEGAVRSQKAYNGPNRPTPEACKKTADDAWKVFMEATAPAREIDNEAMAIAFVAACMTEDGVVT